MKIAKFEKISLEQYNNDGGTNYATVVLPTRATVGSAGYDFFLPNEVTIKPKEKVLVKTGIRCKIENGYVLLILPKSGLGTKYQLALANTVGVIDSDYYYAKNQGHIQVMLVNNGDETVTLPVGRSFVQGIFVPFGITIDDNTDGIRVGGFDSTNKV